MLEIMPKKLTQEEIVRRFREVHGDFYDYSKVEYVDSGTKVCITCPIHGDFFQTPYTHYSQGCGCPQCGVNTAAKGKNMGTDGFVKKARKIHGDKYDYSKTQYITSKEKVCITCPEHGDFWQIPNNHLNGCGCPTCSIISAANKNRKDTEYFIKLARSVHGNRYVYDKSVYISNQTKLIITCKKHGDFLQLPANHTQGAGCPLCKAELLSETQRDDTSTFVSKAKKVHGNDFDYSLVEYVKKDVKVKIICNKCGRVFEQTPNSHLCGTGCPHCNSSKGEERIAEFLLNNGISFIRQYCVKPNDLFCKTKLFKVDFFLPDINTMIEFNGEQHYIPIEHFGGESKYLKQHERDMVLRQYCKNNKIKLIEIPYIEYENIHTILKKELKIHKNKPKS